MPGANQMGGELEATSQGFFLLTCSIGEGQPASCHPCPAHPTPLSPTPARISLPEGGLHSKLQLPPLT